MRLPHTLLGEGDLLDLKELQKKDKIFCEERGWDKFCLLYTSDAADDLLCVDLGCRRIITKKKKNTTHIQRPCN